MAAWMVKSERFFVGVSDLSKGTEIWPVVALRMA